MTSLQALVGSQKLIWAWKEFKKEWEVSYLHLSFSGNASWLVQIKLKLCCCQLVLPSFALLICTPTDYTVLSLVTMKLCGELELPFHSIPLYLYKMEFFYLDQHTGKGGIRRKKKMVGPLFLSSVMHLVHLTPKLYEEWKKDLFCQYFG